MTGELLIVPSAGCRIDGDGLILDTKFATGMALYAKLWPGPVRCVLRDHPRHASPYSARYSPAELPFATTVIAEDVAISDTHLAGAAVVLAAGDDHRQNDIAARCRRLGIPCVYGVEYTLRTRLDILAAERRPAAARARSALWTLRDELRRRRAFRASSGLQVNGAAAMRVYGDPARGDLLYFDNRLTDAMFADPAALDRASAHRRGGAPLRLLFTGRLETMKGADQLVPVMARLKALGRDATLDVFGSGSLAGEMHAAAARAGLADRVTLHAPLDFETALVPRITGNYDLFVCCHPQSDPSCTYIETLGCGIPIAGYANAAFAGILERAPVGWSVPVNAVAALAARIAALDVDRAALDRAAVAGLAFAREHAFERIYAERIAHLLGMVGGAALEAANGAGDAGKARVGRLAA